MDVQLLLKLVKEVEGVAALTVHLVDEDDDRGVAHTAHLHELSCLCLHTFGGVDDDDGGVDSSQRAVGILGKVLVTRGIEDVDLIRVSALTFGQVVELHDRCRHGDTTLLLDVHPVGSRGLANLVVLHGAGHLNLSTEEQELLGERRLTGIRV